MGKMTRTASIINLQSSTHLNIDKREKVKFYILGNMKVTAPGDRNILPRARKSRALLGILCLSQGKPVLRSNFIALLWDRSADAQARMSLRHALSELNTLINGPFPGLLKIDRESVQL